MPTVFETISYGLYAALFEPDHEKRRAAIETWVDSAAPILQSSVLDELRSYLQQILEATQTAEGWQRVVRKLRNPTDWHLLVLDLCLRPMRPEDKVCIAGPVSPETRANTVLAAKRAQSQDEGAVASSDTEDSGGGEYQGGSRAAGPSPNDQRSNVINPNNPAHHAAMNNHSNQMNPNNPAYWSSRGHGGGRR